MHMHVCGIINKSTMCVSYCKKITHLQQLTQIFGQEGQNWLISLVSGQEGVEGPGLDERLELFYVCHAPQTGCPVHMGLQDNHNLKQTLSSTHIPVHSIINK